MRYYLDTEFCERPCTIDLISIGIVAEDGREFYAESYEVDWEKANPWVLMNVKPKLTGPSMSRERIKLKLIDFIGSDKPEFWGYFCDYDWCAFCWLFGSMIDLPKNFPMFCRDLKQEMSRRNITKDRLPPQTMGDAHNALVDARWTKAAHEELIWKL